MKKVILYTLFISLSIIWSCEEKPVEETYVSARKNLTSKILYDLMDECYFWNKTITDKPDLSKDPLQLFQDFIYKPIDKWSFIISTKEFREYYKSGIYVGYGFSFGEDENGDLRISQIFKNSPLYSKGIRRGWIIKSINGINLNTNINIYSLIENSDVQSNTFVFIDPKQQQVEFEFSKIEIVMNTVIFDSIYIQNEKKIGYLVFSSFIETSKEELNTVFKKFRENNINELIVDLRYNGGGSGEIGYLLGGLIGGEKVKDNIIVKYIHNDNLEDKNQSFNFNVNENCVNISRAVFITSRGTASASEMVINGLSPYMDVLMVGDSTHGKPMGMYAWEFDDYTVLPITFKIANSLDYGDYFSGLPANSFVKDDLSHDFGDTNETCFNEALYYIKTGGFTSPKPLKSKKVKKYSPTGWQLEKNVF